MKTKSIIMLGMALIVIAGCKKKDSEEVPVLTTTAASSVTHKTATSGGTISSEGSSAITARGVCWGTSSSPTIANGKTSDGSGTGSFTSSISGLSSSTTYYVRAYATNSEGTGYGNEVSFTTSVAPVNSLSALVGGTSYTATSFTLGTNGGKFCISGMNGTKNLLLWMPTDFTTGAHSLSVFGDYMGQYSSNPSSNIFTSESGTLTITEYNSTTGKVKGTFNFVGTDYSTTINVTNGQFEVYK